MLWISVAAGCLLSSGTTLPQMSLLLLALTMIYCGGLAMGDILPGILPAARCTPHRIAPLQALPAGLVSGGLAAGGTAIVGRAGGWRALLAALVLLALVVLCRGGRRCWGGILSGAACRFMLYVVTGLACAGDVSAPLLILALLQCVYVALLCSAAELEKKLPRGHWSLVPALLAGIPLMDGYALSMILLQPGWLALGIAGGAAALLARRHLLPLSVPPAVDSARSSFII